MLLYIIFGVADIAIVVCLLQGVFHKRRRKQENVAPYVSDFSPSKYLERMEQAGLDILREREKEPVYYITLWLGLDGLRLNGDGSYNWIRREDVKQKSVSVYDSACQSMVNSLDARTAQLQAQLAACCCQTAQLQQTQLIINSLKPAPYPGYVTYNPHMAGYWYNGYTQHCF